MKYSILGQTGLRVSEISLGTAEIGLDYGLGASGLLDEAAAENLLHFALDQGVNLIDTARAYGVSEVRIGQALHLRRDKFILVSKALAGTPAQVRQSVEESLRNLRTDVIDILMIHSASLEVIEKGEVASVLEELRREGLIRFIGASVYGKETAAAAIASQSFTCLQLAYSLLDRGLEVKVAAMAKGSGVALVARSVLLKGALTNQGSLLPNELQELRHAVYLLDEIAQKAGIALPELAYRYVLGTGTVQTALVGARNANEIEQAIRFASAGCLPASVIEEIQSTAMLDEFWLNPGNWPR